MQTPNLVTGQIVKQAETDLIIAAIRSVKQVVLDLLLKQLNAIIPGGFALTAAAGTPIVVNYAQGVAILAGYDLAVPAGSLTVSAANATFHRYDLLTVAYSQTSPTDSAGQATTLDTATPTVVPGTPSASPVLPALPAESVQLGWIDVPPNVTSAQQCVLHQTTADKGPLLPNDLADLTTHLASSMATAVVHGFQATSAGGTETNRLAQTDGNGAVGRANAGMNGSTAYFFGAPGATGAGQANRVVVADANGRAGDAGLFGGVAPSGYDSAGAASGVQANLNTHEGTSPKTAAGVHNFNYDCGVFTPGATDTTVAFNFTWPSLPTAVAVFCCWGAPAPGAFPTGFAKNSSITTTSFVAHVTLTGVPYMWIAVR